MRSYLKGKNESHKTVPKQNRDAPQTCMSSLHGATPVSYCFSFSVSAVRSKQLTIPRMPTTCDPAGICSLNSPVCPLSHHTLLQRAKDLDVTMFRTKLAVVWRLGPCTLKPVYSGVTLLPLYDLGPVTLLLYASVS